MYIYILYSVGKPLDPHPAHVYFLVFSMSFKKKDIWFHISLKNYTPSKNNLANMTSSNTSQIYSVALQQFNGISLSLDTVPNMIEAKFPWTIVLYPNLATLNCNDAKWVKKISTRRNRKSKNL